MLSPAHTFSLTAVAIAAGMAFLWAWKRFSRQDSIALAKRQARARLYAIRLYADDPAIVFRAQRQLIVWTARRLAASWRPMAITTAPSLLLLLLLHNIYGYRPLAPGESAIVTARASGEATLDGRGAIVETPGVRLPDGRQYWRIRAASGTSAGTSAGIVLRTHGLSIAKAVQCGHGLFSSPLEVACPSASLNVFGVGIGWPIWFLLVSLLTIMLFRRAAGVVL